MTSTAETVVSKRSRKTGGALLMLLDRDFTLAVVIGGTVGVGILRTPGEVAANTATPVLLLTAWLAGGAYTVASALPFLELSMMMPRAGGPFVYVRRAFGAYPGFLIGWCDWISCTAVIALLAAIAGELVASLIPADARAAAVATLLALTFIQWRSVRTSATAEKITSVAKVVVLLALVVLAFASGGSVADTRGRAVPAPLTLGGIVAAMQMVIGTYAGWHGAIYFAEEQRDGGRSMPATMLGGLVIVTAIYVVVNVALLFALGYDGLARSAFPAADVAALALGPAGKTIVTIVSVIIVVNVIHTLLLASTRILFALGRDGFFLSCVTDVSKDGTPLAALGFTAGGAMFFSATATFGEVVAMASILVVVVYGSCFAAALRLRRTMPDAPRPIGASAHRLTIGLVLVVSLAFLVSTAIGDGLSAFRALALAAVSFPAFLLASFMQSSREHE